MIANSIPAQFSRDRLLSEASWRRPALLCKVRWTRGFDVWLSRRTLGAGHSRFVASAFSSPVQAAGVKLSTIDDFTVNGQNCTVEWRGQRA
eukprot:4826732-Amphidinium_carterae.2